MPGNNAAVIEPDPLTPDDPIFDAGDYLSAIHQATKSKNHWDILCYLQANTKLTTPQLVQTTGLDSHEIREHCERLQKHALICHEQYQGTKSYRISSLGDDVVNAVNEIIRTEYDITEEYA